MDITVQLAEKLDAARGVSRDRTARMQAGQNGRRRSVLRIANDAVRSPEAVERLFYAARMTVLAEQTVDVKSIRPRFAPRFIADVARALAADPACTEGQELVRMLGNV